MAVLFGTQLAAGSGNRSEDEQRPASVSPRRWVTPASGSLACPLQAEPVPRPACSWGAAVLPSPVGGCPADGGFCQRSSHNVLAGSAWESFSEECNLTCFLVQNPAILPNQDTFALLQFPVGCRKYTLRQIKFCVLQWSCVVLVLILFGFG